MLTSMFLGLAESALLIPRDVFKRIVSLLDMQLQSEAGFLQVNF